jgi:hypothetical protein
MSTTSRIRCHKIARALSLVSHLLCAATLILACLIRAGAQKPDSEFAVTGADLKADEAKLLGPCPLMVKFTGHLTTNGPGTVKYTFTRSDGATGPVFTLDFKSAGTQQVSTAWTLGDATALPTYEGWQALKVLFPNEVESSHETGSFILSCGTAATGAGNKTDVYIAPTRPPIPIGRSKTQTESKEESLRLEKMSAANSSQTTLEKFADRKGSRKEILTEVPQSSVSRQELSLQSLPSISPSEIGHIKTTKVNNVDTRIDQGILQGATRVVDIRRRGPNLSNTSGNSQDADVAAAGDNVYVVWTDDTEGNGEIFLAVSTDHGASFWPPVNLSNTPTHSRNPRVAASGENVYVVWIEDDGFSTGHFTMSRDSADSFSAPLKLNMILFSHMDHLKVVASGGRGYAAWSEVESAGTRQRNIFGRTLGQDDERVQFRDLGGRAMTTIVRVPWHIQDVNVAAGGSHIYVTWNANFRGRNLDPYFSSSTDGGANFRVDQYPEDQASPRGDYGEQWNGGVVANGERVVYYYESNRDASRTVQVMASRSGGASISDGTSNYYALNHGTVYSDTTSEAFRTAMDPHFVIEGDGRFVGAWIVARPSLSGFQSELHYWESDRPDRVLTTSGNPREPQVSAFGGTRAVVYANTTVAGGSNHDVFAHVLGGRGGSYNVSENTGHSYKPKIVASGANYVVVWMDNTPGNTQIFFRAIPAR